MNGKEGCKGEKFCTTDKMRGPIACAHGQRNGLTLENFCHDNIASAKNGLKQGCPLYATKPENVPPSLVGAIEAAELLRKYHKRGVLPPIDKLTAWEFCAYDSAEEASETIESESIRESMQKTNGKGNSTPANGFDTALGKSGEVEPDGPFAKWDNTEET